MTIRVSLSSNMIFEPKHVNVVESIHASETSEIFYVTYKGAECCLKVFHMEDDPGFSDDGRDLCRYRCESQTYEALCSRGVCGSGFVPLFYGTYENLDPELFGNSLDSFKNDRRRPSAILTQYLPGATSLTAKNVTPGLLQQAIEGLKAIHSAWVIHNDAEPKNALVVSNRIVWVDFDVSIVFFGEKRGDLILADEIESEVEFFCSCAHKLIQKEATILSTTDG